MTGDGSDSDSDEVPFRIPLSGAAVALPLPLSSFFATSDVLSSSLTIAMGTLRLYGVLDGWAWAGGRVGREMGVPFPALAFLASALIISSTFVNSARTAAFPGSALAAATRSDLASESFPSAILACARLNSALTFVAWSLRTVVQSRSASSFLLSLR